MLVISFLTCHIAEIMLLIYYTSISTRPRHGQRQLFLMRAKLTIRCQKADNTPYIEREPHYSCQVYMPTLIEEDGLISPGAYRRTTPHGLAMPRI